jgi:hypothetical protein
MMLNTFIPCPEVEVSAFVVLILQFAQLILGLSKVKLIYIN